MKRKAVTVTPAAIQAAARKNTKASARLEGREVPADFVRSPAVERYIAVSGTSDALVPRRETDRTHVQSGMIQSGTGEGADDLLSFLKTEIWPLLEDRSPITKAERERMLDDPTTDRDGGHRVNPRGSLPRRLAKGNPTVSHWNYRVVESFDQTEFFIAEVYYDGDGTQGWVDRGRDFLRWDDYDDLKGTVELLKEAFDKPLLRVVESDRLVEVSST
ncbi:MAG: antitoxin VapB [Mycobacterium sp.]|nr:antitoxin VapB [Mycobacterium sp.]